MAHCHNSARRDFLKLSARLAALGLTGLGFGRPPLFAEQSGSTAVSDYKALVCIYLFGGNDSNNMIVPMDSASYNAYRTLRSNLALTGTALLSPIASANGSPFALHASLTELNSLYASGHLAFVLNTGQLHRPLTKAQYQAGQNNPSNLFSHSDQTLQAQTGTPTLSGSGWGGRLLDCFGSSELLGAVSVSSPALFLQGMDIGSNVIPPGANLTLSGMNITPRAAADARRRAVNDILALQTGDAHRDAASRAFADGLRLAENLGTDANLPALSTTFPNTSIGNQLREVARLIRMRSRMGPGRQVFFCSIDGWDLHASQTGTHQGLFQQLSQAMTAFYNATQEISMAQQITTFTQSEFNRTFQSNGSGSDHAWGSHLIVLGGAVRGGIYGRMPTFAFGGPDDVNTRGVWIPTLSFAQFGATLGRWFGATDANLAYAFPNLANFSNTNIGFMG